MEALLRDVRAAGRSLARSPGFTLAAVLCLALALGAACAVFSVLDGVLFSPLPYARPEGLVLVWGQLLAEGQQELPASGAELRDYRQEVSSFADAAGIVNRYLNLTGTDEPERLVAARVSAGLFPMLGVEAALGRTFSPEEDELGNHRVVLLSHGLWRRRFGGDPEIVGRTITLSDEPYTVVGVMPEGFRFKFEAFEHELWIPIAIDWAHLPPRDFRGLRVMARLAPGVGLGEAQAEVDALARRFARDWPDAYPEHGWEIRLVPLKEQIVGGVRLELLVLAGVVALLLAVACANVANLLLARILAREREVTLRAALGAGRLHLLRHLAAESLLLVAAGAVLGLAAARGGIGLLGRIQPRGLPRLDEVAIGGHAVLFTVAVALGVSALLAALPLARVARPDLAGVLREGDRGMGGGRGGSRLRTSLVVVEVALAVVVTAAAALIFRSALAVAAIDPGFQATGVLTAQVYLSPTKHPRGPDQVQAAGEILDRLSALPGVEAVGGVTGLPLGEVELLVPTRIEDHPLPEGEALPTLDWRPVSPGFFRALGIPLVEGRPFDRRDHAEAPPVAVVSADLARRFWPGGSPVGKRLELTVGQPGGAQWRTIVGVVGPIRALSLTGPAPEQVYTPMAQSPFPFLSLVLRTDRDPLALAPSVRRAIWELDPDQPVDRVQTLAAILSAATAGERGYAALLGLFAGVASLLATVGVYGLMAYSVARRRREMGIRIALGASRREILGRVVGEGLRLAGIGLVLGAVAALGTSRLLAGLLHGVSATDPLTFAAVLLVLGCVALLAAWIPARRAAGVDPVQCLRSP